jgi:hypothetical protein
MVSSPAQDALYAMKGGLRMKTPPIPWTTFFAIVCGLAGAACFTLAQQPLWPSQGHAYALAIEHGMQEASAPDADTLEREGLSHSARDAGYRWAERRGLTDPSACERFQADYRAGCLSWTAERAR